MPSRPSGHSLFAAAFVRDPEGGWTGAEVDLADVELVDDLADAVQEHLGLNGDELTILCVEVEDEWFAIVRYQDDDEPRVFLSDVQAGVTDALGALFAELAGVAPDKESADLGVRPVGDFELLTDLGVTSEELLELSMEEGMLPADTLSVIAERLSFGDELDRLH